MSESEIFQAAVKIAPEQRSAYLDKACGVDLELRREVESLMQAHDATGHFLRDPVIRPQPTSDYDSVAERPGATIGRYQLMEQIGEGGMGLVFVAEQQEPIRRKVALKIIKPGMDSRDVVARFEAERQALAIMDHPHIAKVLDGGATSTGRPYFVMELVKGVPITEYCDEHLLTPCERLELFANVCQAVQHAHSKGVIHRDIKPSNVLVTSHDGKPVVKVIDFGVAKAIGQQLTEKTVYTRFAQMIGTPIYMSPEQAELSGLDIDTRSDIYSLGVLLYELLTGTTPFESDRLKKVAFDEMRRIIREEEPQKPSTRLSMLGETLSSVSLKRKTEPRRLPALVRGDLDWIVMKALEKDRNRRYETASEFGQDIQRHLRDEPVVAGPPTLAYRVRKFVYRRRKALLTGIGSFLFLVAGLGGGAWLMHRALQPSPNEADWRSAGVPYLVKAQEGHVAIYCRSLTLIFEGAPESLIGTNFWMSSLQIPFAGVVRVKNDTGAGGFSVSVDCDRHVNKITANYGQNGSCPMALTTSDRQILLTVGGQSFDVHGEPRTIHVGKDCTLY